MESLISTPKLPSRLALSALFATFINVGACTPDDSSTSTATESTTGNATESQGTTQPEACAEVTCGENEVCNAQGTCECAPGTEQNDEGMCEMVSNPEAPVITDLVIDCSSTGGFCLANWNESYPVNFIATDASTCEIETKVISGNGTPGQNSAVTLNGEMASATHTAGSDPLDKIQLTANCQGPGGIAQPQSIEFVLE